MPLYMDRASFFELTGGTGQLQLDETSTIPLNRVRGILATNAFGVSASSALKRHCKDMVRQSKGLSVSAEEPEGLYWITDHIAV